MKVALDKLYQMKGLPNVNRHKTRAKSLVETLSMYPNLGLDFKVWRKEWPEHKYFLISHVALNTNRTGEVWGVFYENGMRKKTKPSKIEDAFSRTVWNHGIKPTEITLDNGMVYDETDFKKFKERRFPQNKLRE